MSAIYKILHTLYFTDILDITHYHSSFSKPRHVGDIILVTGLVINITSPGFGTDSVQESSGAEFIAFSHLLTKKKREKKRKKKKIKNYFPKTFGFEKEILLYSQYQCEKYCITLL